MGLQDEDVLDVVPELVMSCGILVETELAGAGPWICCLGCGVGESHGDEGDHDSGKCAGNGCHLDRREYRDIEYRAEERELKLLGS